MKKHFSLFLMLPMMVAVLAGLCSCESGKNEPATDNQTPPATFDKVETLAASNVSYTEATLAGRANVDFANYQSIAFGVLVSKDRDVINQHKGEKYTAKVLEGKEFEVTVQDLSAGTDYYYCAWLFLNGIQYEYGEIKTFTTKEYQITGTASVSSTSGRTSCDWVQLWVGGPKWATFNVGATITDYANLTVGADATSYYNYTDQAPYYNTANVGGLYAWNNPNLNGRKTTWTNSVSTGISDVATTLWGSKWQTPTRQQLDTLQNINYGKTTWTWCDGSTVQYVAGCTLKGYKVSGVGEFADKCIFLPAAGYFGYGDGTVSYASYYGRYWSSTEFDSFRAYLLVFDSGYRCMDYYGRKSGQSVRAVLIE